MTSCSRSKSCHDRISVAVAIPIPANASPISAVAGNANSAHQEPTSPAMVATSRNPVA